MHKTIQLIFLKVMIYELKQSCNVTVFFACIPYLEHKKYTTKMNIILIMFVLVTAAIGTNIYTPIVSYS